MQKDRGGRALAIVAICLAVIGLSVAYAALSSTLTYNGTAVVTPATWGVEMDADTYVAPTVENNGIVGHASVTTEPTFTTASLLGYSILLTRPGDAVKYVFEIKNTGSIDAIINLDGGITFTTPNYAATAEGTTGESDVALVRENLTMNLTYKNATTTAQTGTVYAAGTELAAGQLLKGGQSVLVEFAIGYDVALATRTLPTDTVTVTNYGVTVIYGQA